MLSIAPQSFLSQDIIMARTLLSIRYNGWVFNPSLSMVENSKDRYGLLLHYFKIVVIFFATYLVHLPNKFTSKIKRLNLCCVKRILKRHNYSVFNSFHD